MARLRRRVVFAVSPTPRASVVLATFNRPALVTRLLKQLAHQSLDPDAYEVVVVDDGSTPAIAPALRALDLPCALTALEQPNAGAAAARDRGVRAARGAIVVIVDDDMQVEPGFLEAHLTHHAPGCSRVVLGRIRPDPDLPRMPLFERYHAEMLERFVRGVRSGRVRIHGTDVCTGNVSFPREWYLRVGGFDPDLKRSEDAELGVRLEKAGLELVFSEEAATTHGSDHSRTDVWLRRAYLYGIYDLKIAGKHPDVLDASPWRFLFLVNPLSRPLLRGAVLFPGLGRLLARAAWGAASAADRLGLESLGISGATLTYGLEYFRGVREEAGSGRAALEGMRAFAGARRKAGPTGTKPPSP